MVAMWYYMVQGLAIEAYERDYMIYGILCGTRLSYSSLCETLCC